MSGPVPSDQPARNQIALSLEENLFVEAGAGTGKTTALVGRMVALVVDEGVAVEELAAITFTEKAAAELGDRFRRNLEDITRHDGDPARRERAETALLDADLASLTTLHGFARNLLLSHPLEAGLPPGFDLLDEVSSHLSFDDRWTVLQGRLLEDDDLARTMLLADAMQIRPRHLRDLARALDDRWDLLDNHPTPTEPGLVDASQILQCIDGALDLDRNDIDADDKLRIRLALIREARSALSGAVDEAETVRILGDGKYRKSLNVGNSGSVKVWGEDKKNVVEAVYAARDLWDALLRDTAGDVLKRLLAELVTATLTGADERRRAGTLVFHDLLVIARNLLTDPAIGDAVRSSLHEQYRHVLLDEFQDTDPLQLELALLITDPEAHSEANVDQFAPRPGSLFLVGDPKQSIYRFRRADISLYLKARNYLPVTQVTLTENFRTTEPIIQWINAVFSHLISTGPGSDRISPLVQPGYEPLVGRRPEAMIGPPVTLLGRRAHGQEIDAAQLRELEAADVATTITTAIVEGWTIEGPDGEQRPCGFKDIAILLPTRTSLPELEVALEAASIPYRAESSSLLFATPQVRDLLMVLRAIDDPNDDLAVVAALRTPYLGCGDDDLARWRIHYGGTWNHQEDQPDGDSTIDVVSSGLAWMGELHRCRHYLGPSGILERLIHDRRVLQVACSESRPREAWRRARLLSDRARAYTEMSGGSLRGFVDWCLVQADEKGRVAETVLPEIDDDAVRILTIHGAKGLEFPITILSGLSAQTARTDSGVQLLLDLNNSIEVSIREGIQTPNFRDAQGINQRFEDAETIRLLYVAATRCRDHLVISIHRGTDVDPDKPGRPGPGRLLARSLGEVGKHAVDVDLYPTEGSLSASRGPSGRNLPDRQTWLEEHDDALHGASWPRTVSATTIATHRASQKADEDRSRPDEVGRHGTGIGRAVHGALEILDFTATDPSDIVREHAIAEGLLRDLPTINALVRAGLTADSVRQAAVTRHWRELYVAAPIDNEANSPVVEGYIDLAFLEDRGAGPGLVIVDYKTDAVVDDADRMAKARRYRLQGATYALAAQRATGLPIQRVVLCFLAAAGATEVNVDDLPEAMAEAASIARELTGA